MEETSALDDFFEEMPEEYQSEDTTEETADTTEETTDADTAADEASKPDAEQDTENADSNAEAASENAESYTLRVNHEDKVVSKEELMNFAQMGVDYNRVKTNLEQYKADNDSLKNQISEMQSVVDTVKALADASKISVADMLTKFEKARYTAKGYSDREAQMAVERDRAQKAAAKPAEDKAASQQDRAKTEVAEFGKKHPDVSLTEDLVKKLMPDVQSGMTLTDAYEKMQRDDLTAENARLKAELEAAKKNADNVRSSPGSVKDSGKKSKHDTYDDFFDFF